MKSMFRTPFLPPAESFTRWLAACLLLAFGHLAASAATRRFTQDRFGIGFWVAPQTDVDVEGRYAEIAEANFTFVIGLCGGASPMPADQQLRLCEKYGLKALVTLSGPPSANLPDGPAVWGYGVTDEPNASQFDDLRKTVDRLRELRPGKLAYINLFPNYANATQLGTPTYAEHVGKFIAQVQPDVLSMDHYPRFGPDVDGRDNYCRNLEVMSRDSLAAGIPFWNFFNTMPYGPHTDPTEAQLRWQIYTSLAYGAKGVMYFCYWTPRGDEFPKGGAILTADGRRTRHYDEAKRINAGLKNLGPTLMNLTSQGVVRIRPKSSASGQPFDGPLRSISDGDYLIGIFRHQDGRRAVLLNNYHFAYSAWPTVEFSVPSEQVLEVNRRNGKAESVVDDSPDMPGLQLSLDAGEGRLFLLPPP
ncbi:MAG: hypothetical protein IT581_19720 [Verrucomicrobiales bacterium]|nr:hypothetical protein [Verrucomicrobiales bacterium]